MQKRRQVRARFLQRIKRRLFADAVQVDGEEVFPVGANDQLRGEVADVMWREVNGNADEVPTPSTDRPQQIIYRG